MPKELVTNKGDRLSFRDQTWVAWEDYAALRSALREALGAWQSRCKWVDDGITDNVPINDERNRITELRKQFLED